jgi:hypothetical protein
VKDDRKAEPDETFYVNLTNATGGATIADDQGVGTILNDDGAVRRGVAPVAGQRVMVKADSGVPALAATLILGTTSLLASWSPYDPTILV